MQAKIYITLPKEELAAIDAAAAKAGMNRSRWIGEACRARLPKSVSAKLPARRSPGRPPEKS